MSAHCLLAAAIADVATLPGVGEPATPPRAQFLVRPVAVTPYTLTGGRFWSMVAALLGLAGAAVGGLALARPTAATGTRRRRAVVAVASGLISGMIGALVVATADGGPGTGSGIVGGYAALVVGLMAALAGGLALGRTRRVREPAQPAPNQTGP